MGLEAYERGKATADILSNPYLDGSVEARRFVDGWVDGRKWALSEYPEDKQT